MRAHQLYAKINKWNFFHIEVHYLGHVVSNEGIKVDPEKIKAMVECLALRNVDGVRSFMGLASYYRNFIMNFSWFSYPITSFQWKGKKFEWTEECAISFEQLKYFLTNTPFFKIGDLDKEFMVCTYACKRGLGGFLM